MFQRIRNFFKRNDYDEFEYDYYEEGDDEFFSDRIRPKEYLFRIPSPHKTPRIIQSVRRSSRSARSRK